MAGLRGGSDGTLVRLLAQRGACGLLGLYHLPFGPQAPKCHPVGDDGASRARHAFGVAPTADYHVFVRTDQTYALPIPTGAWRHDSIVFPDANGLREVNWPASSDQVHVVGRKAMPSFLAALEATMAKRFPNLHFFHRHTLLRNVTIAALFPERRGPTAVGNSAVKLVWYPNEPRVYALLRRLPQVGRRTQGGVAAHLLGRVPKHGLCPARAAVGGNAHTYSLPRAQPRACTRRMSMYVSL